MDKSEWKTYLNILNKSSPELGRSACSMLKEKDNVLFGTTVCVTAPVLFAYVSWVLTDAAERGKERLYFLARDGYVMYRIAEILCKKYKFSVECRYLYASRIAWRLPQYHLMGEACMDKICLNGIDVTLDKILERGALSIKEKEQIRIQLGLNLKEMDRVLKKEEIEHYKEILIQNTEMLRYVYQHSREAYQTTYGYLEQEGLLESGNFAIVDAGWTGSMQESLNCLIENMKTDRKIQIGLIDGYYFGMLGYPVKENVPENYHTWYFKGKGDRKRKIFFSHNLFECMCCAKDGMTIGYRYNREENQYEPVFGSERNLNIGKWDVEMQINTICRFAKNATARIENIEEWEKKIDAKKMVYWLCKLFMVHPTKEQADCYGKFLFSDDVTEKHVMELAPVMTEQQIRQNSVWNHIKNRLLPNRFTQIEQQSCWMEGTLARSECRWKRWRLFDVFLYKFVLFGIPR